ncbi:rod shape-determining protein MreD [Sphingobium lignivorans]|uniref:Rod shape-determining protein MreD n=1 Tax=Sphingobium lignivorans TaxID=2735886 RepID=A0ABR6NES6_9SPHN|nr:rod shape-determining protein MreD [Sphingobium lignivorans]MBB5985780.1 rod shape-determining protein MreD [Sphingobium lignivorans]
MPRYDHRIGRDRTLLHIRGTPVVSVMIGSMIVAVAPVIAQTPLLPPFGLMIFLAWRLLRPDIWPLWIGLPLGLFDDLMSGQPLGSAIFLWTIILLALDFESQRHTWRDYWHGWFVASVAMAFALAGGWLAVHLAGHGGPIIQILPQIAYSIGLFPIIVRLCAALDRWRLP